LRHTADLPPGSLFYASAGRADASGRSSLLEWAFRQPGNSSHKIGEAVGHWLLGIVPRRKTWNSRAGRGARRMPDGGRNQAKAKLEWRRTGAVVERPDGTRVPFMAFPSVLRD